MLQRGKRAEGPEGSPKPQNGSGLGVQSCPRGHSSLQTPNLSWAGVSSHNTAGCAPASPGLQDPLPSPATRVPQCPIMSHTCPPCRAWLQPVLSPSTEPGETKPILFWKRLQVTPHPHSPHAGGVLVGWMGTCGCHTAGG